MLWSSIVLPQSEQHSATCVQKLLETIDMLEAELRAVKASSGVLFGTVVSRLTASAGVAGAGAGAAPGTSGMSGLSSLCLAGGFSAIGASAAASSDSAERLDRLTRENRSLKRSLDEAEQRALTAKASLDAREESIRRLFDLLHAKGADCVTKRSVKFQTRSIENIENIGLFFILMYINIVSFR